MSPRKPGPAGPRDDFVRVRVTTALRDGLRRIAEQDHATESEVVRRLIVDEMRRRGLADGSARKGGRRS